MSNQILVFEGGLTLIEHLIITFSFENRL